MIQVALAVLLVLQDPAKLRSDFLDAVKTMDESRARAAADAIAAADTRDAVDTLLDGYGLCAQQIKYLWQEKLKNLKDVEANSDFRIDTSTNPPTIRAGDEEKYRRYEKALQASQQTEKRIMRVEAVKRAAVAALARFKSDGAVKELLSKLRSDSMWSRRAGVAEALGAIAHGEVENALLEQLRKDSEPQVKIAILDALKTRKAATDAAVAAICEQLKSELWQIKVTAVEAIKTLKLKDAVEPLIETLQKADGRLKHEINGALVAITGVDKHADYSAWKHWWETNRESVKGGTYQPRKEDLPQDEKAQTTFYGIPVQSRNVVFILDRSGSMEEPSNWDIPPDVASGGRNDGPDIKKTGDRKIDIARWQLKLALARLPDGVEFNLIFFNHEWTILSEKMLKLSPATRKSAFGFIDTLDPVGGTNVYDPLEKGFTFAGVGLVDKIYKSNIDTIFLLTDGMPNAGQIPEADSIVQKIREMNKLKKVKIHTIGVFNDGAGRGRGFQPNEADEGEKFLKRLAEESGGTYVSAFQKK